MSHSKHDDSNRGPSQPSGASRSLSKRRNVRQGSSNRCAEANHISSENVSPSSADVGGLASVDDVRSRLSPAWKWIISGLVLLHLLAVTAEPFRFFTRSARGTSPAADPARWALAPYIELAYLNHGYFFFAPEPGPSHLMECRLDMPDSSQVSLTFPDKRKQWPRLLYHRHFMLAEFLNQLHVPPVDATVVDEGPALAAAWQAERSLFERVRDSMSQHVAAKFGASSARIERLEHRLPSDDEVFRQRLALDSPTLYVTLPDAPPSMSPPTAKLPSLGWQGMGVLLNPEPSNPAPAEAVAPVPEVEAATSTTPNAAIGDSSNGVQP